jgi:hypothetical protein
MLHANVWMGDIDVDHWRNLQTLMLESAKAKRRVVVIHEDGEIQKFIHSQRVEIVRPVTRIDDPHAAAKAIYEANAAVADFALVYERRAFDRYTAEFQGTWRSDEDLDVFVQRTYALMDKYADGIVTYPGHARDTLGLQWRLGTTYAEATGAVARFIEPETSVVFGVFDGDDLWTTLVLRFDADLRADVVTTVDSTEISASGRQALAAAVVSWVEERYGRCSLGLFTDLEGARSFLGTRDKAAAVAGLAGRGALIAYRLPATLASALPGA